MIAERLRERANAASDRSDMSLYRDLVSAISEIKHLEARIAQLELDLDAGRDMMRMAWCEMNIIRARDGAPLSVDPGWWSGLVDAIGAELGPDARPWMTSAARRYLDLMRGAP